MPGIGLADRWPASKGGWGRSRQNQPPRPGPAPGVDTATVSLEDSSLSATSTSREGTLGPPHLHHERTSPQGLVSLLCHFSSPGMLSAGRAERTGINARGWGTGTDFLPVPTCPIWEQNYVQQEHSNLMLAPVLAFPRLACHLVVSVVQGGGGHVGEHCHAG